MWGVGVCSEVGVLIHPTDILWDSDQDSGLGNPFLEPCCPQTIPSQILFNGRDHFHGIHTIFIAKLVFYRRQYATDQNVLLSFRG